MLRCIVVGHAGWPEVMVAVTKHIVPDAPPMTAVGVAAIDAPEVVRRRIAQAIAAATNADGVVVCTDLFGGTPTNLCLPFLEPGRVEIICGINLPLLVKLAHDAPTRSLAECVAFLQRYAQKHIVIASQVLEGQVGGA